jgi:nucleoside-diphosphate-sugar epimerase
MAEYLLAKGHRVVCLVRETSDLTNLQELDVELRYGEITEPESLLPALKQVEYVYHFAGKTKARSEKEYMQINGAGCGHLAQACVNSPSVKMLLYCSSLAAIGPQRDSRYINENQASKPITAYGRSKLLGETLIREICSNKLPWVIIRPTAIYGPKDKDIFLYFKVIDKGWKVLLSGSDRVVSLIYVRDLAELCWLAATKGAPFEIYMASDGEGYTWELLSEEIARILGKKAMKIVVPLWVTAPSALMWELFGKLRGSAVTLNREKVRELRAKGWVVDMNKSEQKLGFKAKYTLTEGLKETALWYRAKGWL